LGLIAFASQQAALSQKYRLISAATGDAGFMSKECFSRGRSFEAKVCEFGDPKASRTLLIFGDSHAMQWVNPIRRAAAFERWRLVTVVKPGCAASDINPLHSLADYELCSEWRAGAIEKILEIRPTAVVMASHNGATLRGDTGTSMSMSEDEIRAGTRRTLLKLLPSGFPVVVLRDSPIAPFNVPACVGRAINRTGNADDSCQFDAAVALNQTAFVAERKAVDGLSNVYYLDMDDLICPGESCPATRNGQIIYRDDNHLTGTYAESLAPVMQTRLVQILDMALSHPPMTAGGS
jgi:hypothetical protein